MNFKIFKTATAKQFEKIKEGSLFRTQVSKDEMWQTYLASFPEGSNPIFRERTEHDCSCCRGFIGAVGNVVALVDGKLLSIWDCEVPGEPGYQAVTNAMAGLVKSKPVECEFLSPMPVAGVDKNFEQITEGVRTWEHFFVHIPRKFVKTGAEIGPLLSESRATHDVFLRSLTEITVEAIDIVLELIGQQSLYRGEEHKFAVDSFRSLKKKFAALTTEAEKDLFVWATISTPASVTKMRNTAIGTLLTDLSEGMEIEGAVRSFESKVAPTNYRRPTALITKSMVEQAKKKLAELGLTSALERRYATLSDISVNDLLFVDRQVKAVVNSDIFDELAAESQTRGQKSFDKIQEVPIEKFLADVLPNIDSMEVMFENRQAGNLVSLVAPTDPTAANLFKWANRFSWSYNGEMADSIKERVKRAGGAVEGDLCCRLAWFNRDDLDFHMVEPSGYEIFYGNKNSASPLGGRLDVDMNVQGETREPVENIFYHSKDRVREGIYSLRVHNYRKRETTDVGFEVEIDILGTVYRFAYPQAVPHEKTITVADIKYSRKDGFEIVKSLPSSSVAREVWGLGTGGFHRVSAMMLSPNYWDGNQVGNRHWFLILDGCTNDGPARGFYNEFLKEELNVHRKVFEVIGSKLRLPESREQMSGIGFSSTKRDSLICRVKGSFTRTIKITF